MFWPLSIYGLLHPKERYIWVQVRILHETEKAILAENDMKIWIPKSRIQKIRLRNNIFEIYVMEVILIKSFQTFSYLNKWANIFLLIAVMW